MFDVSVIIPVYNNFLILENLKEKIIFLSKNYFQIIIIDDYSIDNTYLELLNFLNSNELSNVEICRNEQNMGPSYSRNVGLKKATGEYIAFLDSDDDWHPQKIDIQLKIMQKYNYKICGTNHKVMDVKSLKEEKMINYDKFSNIPFSIVKWPKILFVSPFATPSVVIHKSLKNHYFDETIRYAEDYNLWGRITYSYPAVKVLLPLTYTFKHDYISEGNSLSSNLKKMQLGVEQNFKKFLISKEFSIIDKFYLVLALFFSKLKYLRRINKKYFGMK